MVITTQLKNKVGLVWNRHIWSRVIKSLRHTNISNYDVKIRNYGI